MNLKRSIAATILALLVALPCLAAGLSTYAGFTVRATGYTVQATDWNNEFTNFINHYNSNAIGTLNAVANAGKGAILTWTGSAFTGLGNAGAGDNGKALFLDSTTTPGMKWAAVASTAALTTKGDLAGYSTTGARVPVGADGTVLTADSSNANGVSYQTPSTVPSGVIAMWGGAIANIPGGWALCDGQVHSGTTTPNLQGLFVVGAGNVSPAAVSGMGLLAVGGPNGDPSSGAGLGPTHGHSIGVAAAVFGNTTATQTVVTSVGPVFNTTVTPRYYALCYIQKL